MARKKRVVEQAVVATGEPQEKVVYQDAFQQNVNQRIEDAGRRFEGQGKNILYGLAALAVLATLIGIFFFWNRRSEAQAQTALGRAIETAQSPVTDTPAPAGTNVKTFKTEKERAEASINEFQAVADRFGGGVGEKAKYFIAVNRLSINRVVATGELEGLANANDEVGKLAKFALAQARAGDGKFDEAAALYQELAAMSDPIIAKDSINFDLAGVYQKIGKNQEAADLYYNIAKTASEAKDLDGKAVPLTQTAREAKEKLEELAPERAKEIQEPAPESPIGGAPFGQ